MQGKVNGHAAPEMNGKHADATIEPARYAVRILRVSVGENIFARMLSPAYGGFFTHYWKGKSQYCGGDRCRFACSKLDKTWKGYCACDTWNARIKKWQPAVLEITEHLELDMRGIFARGQVWELWRQAPTDGKPTPVMGKLQEERDPATMPPEFDWISPLKTLYHVQEIYAQHKNPLPPRVIVSDTDGDGPAILNTPEHEEATVEKIAQAREQLKGLNSRMKSPTEKKLGS